MTNAHHRSEKSTAHRRRLPRTLASVLAIVVAAASASSAAADDVNGRIAFSSDRSGVFAIWTITADGTAATQLTHHDASIQDWWPVVSPDGRQIAFTRYAGTGGASTSEAIYLMNADGSGLRRLSRAGTNTDDNLADFSPDGHHIAFISDRNDPNLTTGCRQGAGIGAPGCNWEIYVMNADGTGQRRVTHDPGADVYPEFSPHGNKIMFGSTRSGSSAVYTMNRDGSDVAQVTADSIGAGDANWSPDGSRITFVGNFFANDNEIFTSKPDGTDVTQLTNYGDHPTLEPEYSPDGTTIVFGLFGVVSPTAVCCGPADLVVMNAADGSGKTNITNTAPGFDSETPDWGPAAPHGLLP